MTLKPRLIDNAIVKTEHKAEVSVTGKSIGNACNKLYNMKYHSTTLDNVIVLPRSKFNLISAPVMLHKG